MEETENNAAIEDATKSLIVLIEQGILTPGRIIRLVFWLNMIVTHGGWGTVEIDLHSGRVYEIRAHIYDRQG